MPDVYKILSDKLIVRGLDLYHLSLIKGGYMASPAGVARHPIHPMLIVFPIALWIFAFVCDLIFRFGSGAAIWNDVAYISIAGGIMGALIAAIPGFIDFLSLFGRPRSTAVVHMQST